MDITLKSHKVPMAIKPKGALMARLLREELFFLRFHICTYLHIFILMGFELKTELFELDNLMAKVLL